MAPYRKHQKVKKQDTDGLLHHNDAMTSVPNTIQQLVHYSVAHIFLDFLVLPVCPIQEAPKSQEIYVLHYRAIPRLYIWKMFLHLVHMVFV